ncbi:MAG: hypothetical protein ACOZNI_36095 [Myxococcota bacterium]
MLPTLFLDLQNVPSEQALVTIDAPADARGVVAILPWGDTASLRWDPLRGRWYERVAVPAGAGEVRVAAYVMDAGGGTTRVAESVRARPLDVLVEVEDGFTRVTVYADEPLRTLAVAPPDAPALAELREIGPEDDAWAHVFEIPGLWEEVRVVGVDLGMRTLATTSQVEFGG